MQFGAEREVCDRFGWVIGRSRLQIEHDWLQQRLSHLRRAEEGLVLMYIAEDPVPLISPFVPVREVIAKCPMLSLGCFGEVVDGTRGSSKCARCSIPFGLYKSLAHNSIGDGVNGSSRYVRHPISSCLGRELDVVSATLGGTSRYV